MVRALSTPQGHTGGGIIKTIIMPNEEINRLGVEVEELRQHLLLEKQIYEESIAAFEKDRNIRNKEFDLKEADF